MAAPEIRLSIGLDLEFFRGQMRKAVNIAQSEFTAQLAVKIDRNKLNTELNNLQKAIKRRTYRIEIGGNLEKAPDKIASLKKALSDLEGTKIDLGIGGITSIGRDEARKIRTALRRSILENGGKILVPTSIVAAITEDDVAAFQAIVKRKLSGIKASLSVVAGINSEDIATFKESTQSKLSGIKVPVSILPKISAEDITAFKEAVKNKLSGIKVKVGVEAQVSGAGAGAATVPGERKRPAGYEAALQSIGNLQVEQLRKRAFSSLGEESRTAQQVSTWLNTIVDQGLKGKAKASQLTAVREFLAEGLATAAGKNIEARMQPLRGQTSIEAARSATNINKILDPIAQYTQNSKAAQQMLRMLPESRISTNTLDVASKQARYYESVPSAKSFQSGMKGFDPLLQSIAKDFVSYTKSLSSTNPWVGKISGGIAEMVSAAAAPLQAQKLLPAAGQSNASRMTRSMFEGLPPIQAPSIGQEKAPLSRAATRSLNKARQLLGMSIGPTSPYAANPWAGTATVPPVTPTAPSNGLPPAGATSNYGAAARRQAMAQAFQQYGFRQAPSIPPPMAQAPAAGVSPPGGPPAPPGGGGAGVGGGGAGVGGAGRRGGGIGGLNIPNLPGAGLVQEIGTEFAFAAKQVLLFGTAYKALAFLTGFPQQVGDAVGALQTFRNTLNTISPSAGEAAASSQFILDIVDKYNVPLQSARDGFTKLYASMQPAGFSGNEIRDLFLGISQSAATFGMSADKVDRVNYAFAQMASKGQVMSEELKGQLGDVLPGAMAIFAEAAGFKGPEAIKTFSKALEDGAYKGGAMKALLLNVGTIMRKEFGPGAEGAARTFQGSINRMQNSLKLLYESFEPVAIGFLNSVVVPMTKGIKTVADGLNTFFSGAAAQSSNGAIFAQQLEALRPAFEGIRSNLVAMQPVLQTFGKILLEAGKIALQLAGNPLVGYLARLYVIILPLNIAMRVLRGLWASNALQLLIFNTRVASGTTTMTAFRGMMAATGATATATAGNIRSFSIALRAAFSATAVGLAVVGLGMIAEAFMTAGARSDAAREKMAQFADSVKQLGAMGDIAGATAEKVGQQSLAARLQSAKALLQQVKTEGKKLTKDQVQELKNLQLTGNLDFVEVIRGPEKGLLAAQAKITDLLGTQSALQSEIESAGRGYLETQTKIVQATKAVTAAQGVQKKREEETKAVDLAGGEETKPESLETYYSLQDQLAKAASAADIARIQDGFEERFRLANSYYDLQEARANSLQKITINFQKELLAIEQRRQKAMLDAELDVRKARESVVSEAMVSAGEAATGGIVARTGGAVNQNPLTRGRSTGPHLHAQAANVTENTLKYLVDKYLEIGGKAASSFGQSRGAAGHGYNAVDFLTPQDTPIKLKPGASISQYGPAGGKGGLMGQVTTPEGSFQLGHLTSLAASQGTVGAGAPGKILGSERRQTLATQQTGFALEVQRVANLVAEKKAADDAALAIENYVAAIAPVAEQELQNQLLSKRIELMQTGITGDYLDAEIKVFEIQEKQKFAIASATAEIERNNKAVDAGKMGKDDANRANAKQNDTINRLIANVPKYITLLELQTVAQQKLNFEAARGELNKQMTMARALTPDAELKVQLREKYPGDISMQEQEFAQTKLLEKAGKLKQDLQNIASSIGNAFGDAFSKVITGAATAQEALAGMFQGIADSFAQMVQEMIAQWLKTQILEGFGKLFNLVAPLAGAAGGFSSGAAGFGGGFDSGIAALPGIPDFSGAFKTAANGAVWTGGFQAFADGGIVKGPTLGLVGEGRYNEAVVPLPDGKSIPVDLSGMGGGAGSISTNIVINVNNGQAQSNTSGGASDLGRKMEGAVKQVLANELRPGGLLSGGRR